MPVGIGFRVSSQDHVRLICNASMRIAWDGNHPGGIAAHSQVMFMILSERSRNFVLLQGSIVMKTLIALLWMLTASATPVLADGASRVFVASTGDDASDGSREKPKRSFQAAHDAVAAGGDIVALDTAGYGQVMITKSVSIVVPPGVSGLVPVSAAGTGIRIDAPNAVVAIRGVIVVGDGRAVGILAENVRQLIVEDTDIRKVGMGIYLFAMSNASLHVRGGVIRNVIEGVVVAAGAPNIAATGTITDVTIIGTGNDAVRSGVYATGSNARIVVSRCTITDGTQSALVAEKGGEIVLDNSTITNHRIAFDASGQFPAIYSRGNNTVFNNQNLGDLLKPLAPQ